MRIGCWPLRLTDGAEALREREGLEWSLELEIKAPRGRRAPMPDANTIRALTEMVAPVMICLILSGSVLGAIFIGKHFKLRAKELELEATLHSREAEARLRAMETRQAAIETALTSLIGLAQAQSQRMDPQFASPPDRANLSALPLAVPGRERR